MCLKTISIPSSFNFNPESLLLVERRLYSTNYLAGFEPVRIFSVKAPMGNLAKVKVNSQFNTIHRQIPL